MFRSISFLMFLFVVGSAYGADKCVAYKLKPYVNISKPDWVKKVVQPLEMMDLYHGNVVATLVDDYDIVVNVDKISDGFCVGIKNINATIGYSDFLVKIDMRHKLNSCSYNAVLSHENQHIDAYLSVINDFQKDIKQSVYSAANSIMPVYVKNKKDIDGAINKLNSMLQVHPDLVLIKQKISAAEEIRNAKVDEKDKQYEELKKCDG